MSGRGSPQGPEQGLVLLGEFGRAHGLKGEVRLKSFTADPSAIAEFGPFVADDGRSVALLETRRAPGGAPDLLIARVEGVTGRDAAEALNRVQLFVPKDRLPPPEDEDEFLQADLIGLEATDSAGRTVGRVVAIPNYGSGDLIEIAPAGGGPTLLVPFVKAFVPDIDLATKRIVVDYAESVADESEVPTGETPRR